MTPSFKNSIKRIHITNVSIIIITSLHLLLTACSENPQKNAENITKESKDLATQKQHTPTQKTPPLSFNEHIQPILSANCYHCHGPDSGTREPKDNPLRLDTKSGAFAKRSNGKPVIIKGDPDSSYLIQLIESKDPQLVMPLHPTRSPHGKIMPPSDIALIRRWVKEGAHYQKHWSYIPPKKTPLPIVKNKHWPKNYIDHYILHKLEKHNLSPNPPQNKARLLRRLSFDLTGLPPTPNELAAFTSDTREFETVYQEKITALLNSNAYAEHFARHWLDVARYADTHGIHLDNFRSIWPYRDWVINAFRSNMKFDQFTLEQIAGDMLNNPTLNQKIATGFHRCLPTTGEAGSIEEEYHAVYAQERVNTTSSVWLGLTTGCAACHDHKFDAITTKENYQLTAFFRNTTMSALDGHNAIHPPNISVPAKTDQNRYHQIKQKIQQLTQQKKSLANTLNAPFQKWLKLNKTSPNKNTPTSLTWQNNTTEKATTISKTNAIKLINKGDFEKNQPFSFSAWIKIPDNPSGSIIAKMQSTKSLRGYDLHFKSGKLVVSLNHSFPKNYLQVMTIKKAPTNQWSHITVTYDGSEKAHGINIYINEEKLKLMPQMETLTKSIRTKTPLIIGRREKNNTFENGQIKNLRIYNHELKAPEISKIVTLDTLNKNNLTKKDTNKIKTHYFSYIHPDTHTIHNNILTLQKELHQIRTRATYTLIMDSNPYAKPTAHILIRGEYAVKDKEILTPKTPASLPPMTADMPPNRLGLAKWLIDKNNPLPARVTVNRYWSYLFGTGIVNTNQDFGIMGARPSHPKLLDHLAVDFTENSWDLHHLIRQIVTSSTYRQSSKISPNKLQTDPLNKLLARSPRYRLDAEQIRDLALSSSNLLHNEIGGPPVKPYQPSNIWKEVSMPQSNTKKYQHDSGYKLYRRSIYTFWKRTAIHPVMEILNAPSRDTSCVQRERTNTPLQALVIMNDPQFIEASRQLAAKAIKNATSTEKRINIIATSLISREMTPSEIQIIKTTLATAIQKFNTSPNNAKKLTSIGETKAPNTINTSELAAWTIIANQILNMDETLNK